MRKHLVSAPGIAVRRGQSAVLIPNELLVRVARTDYADAGLRSCSEHEFGRQTNWENLEPLEFMQRLAAPVPRPWLHLIRFHGVLAPNRSCALKSFPVRQSLQPKIVEHGGHRINNQPHSRAPSQDSQPDFLTISRAFFAFLVIEHQLVGDVVLVDVAHVGRGLACRSSRPRRPRRC